MKKFAWKMKRTGAAAMLLVISMTMAQGLGTANVWAADETKNLTDAAPAGTTDVTGIVSGAAPGSVTYTISIPSKIDFGTLYQPQTAAVNLKTASFNVSLTQISNLSSGSVVAVFMKDSQYGTGNYGFRIAGTDNNNSLKTLYYSVSFIADNQSTRIIDTSKAAAIENYGYVVYGFNTVGQKKQGTVSLDQAQLYNATLSDWAGNYKGMINFYSGVEDPASYTLINP